MFNPVGPRWMWDFLVNVNDSRKEMSPTTLLLELFEGWLSWPRFYEANGWKKGCLGYLIEQVLSEILLMTNWHLLSSFNNIRNNVTHPWASLKGGPWVARNFCLSVPGCCSAKQVYHLVHLCTELVNKVGPRLRDPASQFPLAAGASSRNLGPTFFPSL